MIWKKLNSLLSGHHNGSVFWKLWDAVSSGLLKYGFEIGVFFQSVRFFYSLGPIISWIGLTEWSKIELGKCHELRNKEVSLISKY